MTEVLTMDKQEIISDERIERLINDCRPKVFAYLKKFSALRGHADPEWSECAIQDATIKALKSKHTYKREMSFTNWFMRIAINAMVDIIKDNYRNGLLPHNLEYSDTNEFIIHGNVDRSMGVHEINEVTMIEQSDNKITIEKAMAILNQLPENLRLPLYKLEIEDMDYESIAADLGISVAAVRVRVCRAKKIAREKAKSFLS